MLEDPDDPGTLLVYADWLLARGDPRGDLITLHHALDGERDPTRVKALRESEATLLEQHRDRLFPAALRHHAEHQLGWARGFIRTLRLELTGSLTDADLLREVLAHPSLRCLTELQLAFSRAGHEAVLGALAELAPQALRTLHLGREGSGGAPVQFETLEALPRLEHLVLHRGIRGTHPVHPRLHRLELVLASDVLWGGDRGGH